MVAPLPRRRRARGRARPRARERLRRAAASEVAGAARRRRAHARRSTRSGSACGGSTATSRSARRGSSPRTRRRPASSTSRLRSLAEGLRVVTVLLHPYMPASTEQAARRARVSRRRRLDARARSAPGRAAAQRRRARAAVPEARSDRVIDTHTHLDTATGDDAELVADARARPACARMLTIGMDGASCRAALAAAEALPAGVRGDRPPSQPRDGLRRRRPGRAASAGRPPALPRRSARPGSTSTATARRAPTRSAPSPRRSSSRASRQAAGHPHARGRGRHARHARASSADGAARDPALLLHARPAGRVPRPRLVDLLRRQRHLPEVRRAARGRARGSRGPPARRDRRAVPRRPRPCARSATSPRTSSHTAARRRRARAASPTRSWRRRSSATPPSCSAGERPSLPVAAEPAPPARVRGPPEARRSARTSSIDSNILGVIARAAELGPDDVVLEIGGGLGVLSEHLARARARTSTSSRSTARSSRRCATRSTRTPTPRCTSPTR